MVLPFLFHFTINLIKAQPPLKLNPNKLDILNKLFFTMQFENVY